MRNRILVASAAVFVLLLGIVIMLQRGSSTPDLIIDDSVADDFAAVATADWVAFVDSFPAHRDCIGDVTLVADYDLDDLARYDPVTRTMAVRVPAPQVLLDRAVTHELAHHLEVVCPAQVAMRPAFLAALGRSGDSWFEGAEWGLIPSEIFAESVVEYVLDERGRVHTKIGVIDPAAVDVVVVWATQ